jgi:hypothetical protein
MWVRLFHPAHRVLVMEVVALERLDHGQELSCKTTAGCYWKLKLLVMAAQSIFTHTYLLSSSFSGATGKLILPVISPFGLSQWMIMGGEVIYESMSALSISEPLSFLF